MKTAAFATMIALGLAIGEAAAAVPKGVQYVENDRVRVGVDLDAGGAIMHVEDKLLRSGNMINRYDRGRQIQQSYYSGPVPFIGPNGEKPAKEWKGLGWNPIQTGDCGGNASPVLAFERPDEKTMFIRTAPMLWPHHGVRAECTFETTIRLTENGFRFVAAIANARTDKTDYGRKPQEEPAVYTNAKWHRLVAYLGDRPWTEDKITTIVDKGDGKGWPWRTYVTPERWSALLDEGNAGIGVFNATAFTFGAGFAGNDAEKGQDLPPTAAPTGYIAPDDFNVLDWNARIGYEALFAVGKIDEIRRTFAEEAKRHPYPQAWTFGKERLRWTHENAVSQGYPLAGAYAVRLGKDARLLSPFVFLPAKGLKDVRLVAAYRPNGTATQEGGALEIAVDLVPFAPADQVDYPAWDTASMTVASYRKKMAAKHPEMGPIRLKARVPGDGKPHEATLPIPATAAQAFKQVRVTFPGTQDGVFELRALELR